MIRAPLSVQQAVLYLDTLPPSTPLAPHLRSLAQMLECHPNTLRQHLRAYRAGGQTFAPRRRQGAAWNAISTEVETIITRVLNSEYFTPERPSLTSAWMTIQGECRLLALEPPSYTTVRQRMQQSRTAALIRHRDKLEETARLLPTPGFTECGAHPLDLVACDHSPVDVMILDPQTRQPIGRPTLTLIFCTCSRLILGYLISFQKPSVTSVALALAHAVLPKTTLLAAHQIAPGDWPAQGLPQAIQVDNAREFHSEAFETACRRWHIQIRYRRVRRPRDGSLIENVIGRVNRKEQELPGTTFSHPRARNRYPSAQRAIMTLREFDAWFTHQVITFNHLRHRTLGISPQQRWSQGDFTQRAAHDPETFTLDFLPHVHRVVNRLGVQAFGETYWSTELSFLIGQGVSVKYDPQDISRVFVFDPRIQKYIFVPFRNVSKAPTNLWTHRAERAQRRSEQDVAHADRALDHHMRAREVVRQAKTETLRVRTQLSKARTFQPIVPLPTPEPQSTRPVEWPDVTDPIEPWPES